LVAAATSNAIKKSSAGPVVPTAASAAAPSYSYNIPPAAAAIAAEARQQHMANMASANASKAKGSSSARTPSSATGRRASGTTKGVSLAMSTPNSRMSASGASSLKSGTPSQTLPSARPTSQPSHSEARLTSQTPGVPHMAPLVGQRLRDLVQSLDPNYSIDAAAEDQVLQLVDDFLDKVTRQSIRMSQHRGSKTLDVQDLQVVLAKQWGIVVPGLGAPTFRPNKASNRTNSAGQTSKAGVQLGTGTASGTKRKASDASLGAGSRTTSKLKATGASLAPATTS